MKEEELIKGNYYIHYDYGICMYKDTAIGNTSKGPEKCYVFIFAKSQSLFVYTHSLDKIIEFNNEYGECRLSVFNIHGNSSWLKNRKKILMEAEYYSKNKEALFLIEKYENILVQAIENKKTQIQTKEIINDREMNDFLKSVLKESMYPKGYIKNVEIEYEPISKQVIINYRIPNTDEVPKITEYRYNSKTEKIIEVTMKDKEFNKYYESVIFQITLRSIKEVFDMSENLESIVFNGWVEAVDKRTGSDFQSCIISLMVSRDKFEHINLAQVSLKDCILHLKGIFTGQLYQLAPVKPILNINRADKRFIDNKDILSEINEGVNLAEMDWEDFEYLVRELFEKIFSNDGSEVKVTQASRDGGVDAVAFDNDPIRGGKFIIQAKRYNNVVPVSAVRDLYGTVINEGAVKGILVTTSYFGNDSREFAKDKPIALIDGSNIVYLLNKYGHKSYIELKKTI